MLCNLCKKEIQSENFPLHEVLCQKNNVKCTKCDEFVFKLSMAEHMKEHELKTCENCEIDFESKHFDSHICTNPAKTCKYCEAVLKPSLFVDHLPQCESRTQECLKCLRFVMNKDWESHQELVDCAAMIKKQNLDKYSSSSSISSSISGVIEDVKNNDEKILSYKCKVSIFKGPFRSAMTGVRIIPRHMNRYFNANDYEQWISQNYQ